MNPSASSSSAAGDEEDNNDQPYYSANLFEEEPDAINGITPSVPFPHASSSSWNAATATWPMHPGQAQPQQQQQLPEFLHPFSSSSSSSLLATKDNANIPTNSSPGLRKRKLPPAASHDPFPRRLFQMLQDAPTHGFADIVTWVDQPGTCFRVHQKAAFEGRILPLYFSTSKMKSFQRQLNFYGFERHGEGELRGAYFHPQFCQAKPEESMSIHRRDSKRAILQQKQQQQQQSQQSSQSGDSATMESASNNTSTFPPQAGAPRNNNTTNRGRRSMSMEDALLLENQSRSILPTSNRMNFPNNSNNSNEWMASASMAAFQQQQPLPAVPIIPQASMALPSTVGNNSNDNNPAFVASPGLLFGVHHQQPAATVVDPQLFPTDIQEEIIKTFLKDQSENTGPS